MENKYILKILKKQRVFYRVIIPKYVSGSHEIYSKFKHMQVFGENAISFC